MYIHRYLNTSNKYLAEQMFRSILSIPLLQATICLVWSRHHRPPTNQEEKTFTYQYKRFSWSTLKRSFMRCGCFKKLRIYAILLPTPSEYSRRNIHCNTVTRSFGKHPFTFVITSVTCCNIFLNFSKTLCEICALTSIDISCPHLIASKSMQLIILESLNSIDLYIV